jgi:hypothetical protein
MTEGNKNTHTLFYYGSLEHLAVNMYYYIKNSIDNNKQIYLLIEPGLYKLLINSLLIKNIDGKNIQEETINKLINKNIKSIITNFVYLENEAKKNGYKGADIICQATYAIKNTSKNFFLEFEDRITDALNKTDSSMLCLYDFDDYMYKKKYIDEDIFNESFKTHSYILLNFKINKMNFI